MNRTTSIRRIARQIEALINAEIAPRVTGRRVLYIRVPGRATSRAALTPAQARVFNYFKQHPEATAADLRRRLVLNPNTIAGALYALRRAGLVKSQTLTS